MYTKEKNTSDEANEVSRRALTVYLNEDAVMEEVKKTGKRLVIYNKEVYDVGEFIDVVKHPGGNDLIEDNLGTDITEKMEEVQHSENAYKALKKYKIGLVQQSKGKTASQDKKIDADEHERPPQKLINSINAKMNLKEPVFYQIFKANFTLEEYLIFIHDPKILNDPPRDVRIFKSDFCEFFSMTPWYAIPIFWFPIIISILILAYNLMEQKSLATGVGFYVFGLFIWTLVEYLLHRFVFHYDERLPTNNFMFCIHFLTHGIHHAFPQDRYRLVFPIILGVCVASVIGLILCALLGYVRGLFAVAGFGTFYVMYDIMHYSFHHVDIDNGVYKRLKAYHTKHHYKDYKLGFGVTSMLWDYVFGTVLYY
jgi:4-hydroxysphinganine ceramide fatty acyl 2-hydroxylase